MASNILLFFAPPHVCINTYPPDSSGLLRDAPDPGLLRTPPGCATRVPAQEIPHRPGAKSPQGISITGTAEGKTYIMLY